MQIENPKAFVWEFWGQSFALHEGGSYKINIPPHSARVLYFTDEVSMAVIGSDACVVMQTPWSKDGKRIAGKLVKPSEAVFVASNTALRATDCQAEATCKVNEYTVYRVTSENENFVLEEM